MRTRLLRLLVTVIIICFISISFSISSYSENLESVAMEVEEGEEESQIVKFDPLNMSVSEWMGCVKFSMKT